jgi:hypothetical protein
MAYRTSARTAPADAAVCCVRCGALTAIAFAERKGDDFECACGHAQPVLPEPDDVTVTELRLKDYAIGKYDELTPFSKELGKYVQTSGLDLVVDGIECKVGLNINSGTVTGLDHHAATTGLPTMRFLKELPHHVSAKSRDVVKEVQTGDAAFDDEVYIESASSDADVLTVLASPAVRKAIRVLLGYSRAIVVDGAGASFFSPKDFAFDPKGIRDRLRWLRVVAGAPRPLVSEPVTVPARARISKRIVGWSSPVAVFLFILGVAKWTPVDATPVFECLGAGVVIALVMLPIWTMLLRGRSTSHREILTMRIITFIFAPLLVAGVLLTSNGAFDSSAERKVTMKIVSAPDKGGDDESFHARAVDDQGASYSYSFKTKPQEGQHLRVGWKEGAFGWRWESSDAIVIEAAER